MMHSSLAQTVMYYTCSTWRLCGTADRKHSNCNPDPKVTHESQCWPLDRQEEDCHTWASAIITKTSTSGKLASLAGFGLPISRVYVFLPAARASRLTSSAACRKPATPNVPTTMPALGLGKLHCLSYDHSHERPGFRLWELGQLCRVGFAQQQGTGLLFGCVCQSSAFLCCSQRVCHPPAPPP